MKKILIYILLLPTLIHSQNNFNLSVIGEYEWPNTEGSDIWGWVDGSNEYALVGLNDGFSVVDVTIPTNPIEIFYIPDLNSTWRDIKTWGNYAYVTTEADAGLLIVDLAASISGNLTYWHVTNFLNPNGNSIEFTAAHNIYIDEEGIAYIFGASSTTQGSNPADGAIFLDVAANPTDPVYLGEWDDYYIHDGMVRGDTLYAGCIYEGELYVVDVSDKSNPQVLGHKATPSNFTHNAWVSDNGQFVFTTDEQSDAYIAAYDISNISNIQEVDRIQSNPGSNSIPHNTHVDGNFLITSYYRDGTTVHDITYPNNMIQVAYYDSYTLPAGSPSWQSGQYEGDGFDGCWGTYPFLPSGNIISSDINSSNNQSGKLLVYRREFNQACYLEGNVTEFGTNNPIDNANIEILNTVANLSNSNLLGNYTSGVPDAGTYDVIFSKYGYISDTLQATLTNGNITYLDAELDIDTALPILGCTDSLANNYNPLANVSVSYGGPINNTILGGGGYFDGNQHLIFDAYEDCIIKSATFYSDGNNIVTFELRDNNGNVIDDTTYNMNPGSQTITLNFNVPTGNSHQLGIATSYSELYRNDEGANYPYNIDNVISITGSSASQSGYYYFYYNIEVIIPCENTITNITNHISEQQKLLRIVDVMGKEIKEVSNQTLFYIYSNGIVKKKIIIE